MRHPTEEQTLKIRERVNENPGIPISLLADDPGLPAAAAVDAFTALRSKYAASTPAC